jgi:hypothetical protein
MFIAFVFWTKNKACPFKNRIGIEIFAYDLQTEKHKIMKKF